MSVDPYKELKGICQSEMRDLEKLYAAWDDTLRHTDTQVDSVAYRKRVKRLRAKTDKCVRMVNDLNLSVRELIQQITHVRHHPLLQSRWDRASSVTRLQLSHPPACAWRQRHQEVDIRLVGSAR